ncbi:hypothetical protein FEM48_Zijuj02G0052100 [Ziziphus jujuba var. spinosa]|uniref:SelT-like protein n=1 Tax=Ziziphus jujuba var. spinosa TaxID=714518 RepID=A0A978VTU2_ZIZJJ|nr:hypothetical protein FEM48_Zijuj02G0052100 [Ziziphus jujuba var. spinosa]
MESMASEMEEKAGSAAISGAGKMFKGSTLNVGRKAVDIGGIGFGNTVKIDFCSSCSYKGTAITMNKMLETAFPGVEVVLANYPPSFPKRLLSKLVPVVQIGVMGIVIAGEQIFPMLGFVAPPPWYYSLRANKFGTIATSWLLGNVVQNFLQSTGAFEVYLNDELIFSKLKEGRFPSEIELKSIVGKKLANSRITDSMVIGGITDGLNIGEL